MDGDGPSTIVMPMATRRFRFRPRDGLNSTASVTSLLRQNDLCVGERWAYSSRGSTNRGECGGGQGEGAKFSCAFPHRSPSQTHFLIKWLHCLLHGNVRRTIGCCFSARPPFSWRFPHSISYGWCHILVSSRFEAQRCLFISWFWGSRVLVQHVHLHTLKRARTSDPLVKLDQRGKW